jgi:hypothetical protein
VIAPFWKKRVGRIGVTRSCRIHCVFFVSLFNA